MHPDWVRNFCSNAIMLKAKLLCQIAKTMADVFLDETQQAALEAALSAPPSDGGLWTGPKVAAWISETLERPVSAVSGWKYLKRWVILYKPLVPAMRKLRRLMPSKPLKKTQRALAILESQHPEKPVLSGQKTRRAWDYYR